MDHLNVEKFTIELSTTSEEEEKLLNIISSSSVSVEVSITAVLSY